MAHRPFQLVTAERGQELPGTKLAASIAVHDAAGHAPAACDGHVERVDGDLGLHPVTDGVADDPVGPHVLDRALVQLALIGPVLGDVGQPQLVRPGRGEVPLDQVVVGRRAGLLPVLAALLPEHRPPAVGGTDPPHGPVTACVTGLTGLISQQPVAELGIIGMGVEDRVGQIGLIEVPVGDRAGEPAVVRLAGELQDPARDRDGDPVAGQLTNERVHHFPGRFACDK